MRRADPDYYAGWVMNNALGQYALGGRLGDSIRERQGMAYYVYSTLDASLAEGPLMIRAACRPTNVERTIASIDRELDAGARRRASRAKELDESKRYLIGSIPRQLETNAGIAGFLLSAEFHGLGPDYDARLPGLLDGGHPGRGEPRWRAACSIRDARRSSWRARGRARRAATRSS